MWILFQIFSFKEYVKENKLAHLCVALSPRMVHRILHPSTLDPADQQLPCGWKAFSRQYHVRGRPQTGQCCRGFSEVVEDKTEIQCITFNPAELQFLEQFWRSNALITAILARVIEQMVVDDYRLKLPIGIQRDPELAPSTPTWTTLSPGRTWWNQPRGMGRSRNKLQANPLTCWSTEHLSIAKTQICRCRYTCIKTKCENTNVSWASLFTRELQRKQTILWPWHTVTQAGWRSDHY